MIKPGKLLGKRKSIFISWLLSYFTVIAVCIAVSSAMYVRAERLVAEEINTSNEILLQQIQQSADSRLKEIVMLGNQISVDKNVMGMFYVKEPLTPNDRMTSLQIVNSFKSSSNANTYISFYYVYFSSRNSVIAMDGVYDRAALFDIHHKSDGLGYKDWEALMNGEHRGEFMPFSGSGAGSSERTIAYLKSLLLNDAGTKVTLCVTFEESRLLEAIKTPKLSGKGAVLVLNSSNEIISSTTESGHYALDYSALSGSRGIIPFVHNNEKMVVSYRQSEINDWKYVSVVSVSQYMEKVESMRRLTYISMSACLVLGSFMAFMAVRRNYNPVKNMMNFVNRARNKEAAATDADGADEFSFIQDFIESTLTEKDEYYQDWKRHSAELKSFFLQRLLKGDVEEELYSNGILASYEIRFATEQFAVLLFCMEDFSRLFANNKSKDRRITEFLISNVAEELANQHHAGWLIKMEDMVACLINFKTADMQQNLAELNRIAVESRTFLEEKLRVDVSIAKSGIHEGVGHIPLAYKETLEAMDYRIVFGSGTIIGYGDIKPAPRSYSFTMLTEQRFINSIKAGDYEQAGEIINAIFTENFSQNTLSLEMTQCFMFSLVNAMMKALEEISMLLNHQFLDDLKPVERLLKCKSVSSMKEELDQILLRICEYVREVQKKSRNDGLRDAIMTFIEEHYHDVNLGVAGIAEAFQLNPIQMSRFFREQNGGETLPDYINRFRIGKAKQLLEYGDTSISAIAIGVGYSNANTFIRSYKKYEGITPGKFRELNRHN
ncbi:MAG: transcriptional regulator, AraC family [Paenibacillaceae bacterium]|jgi:YesN/AraC family two-component response regulator|nr:transcriptional regulator, AraC family [Paenibacillaceae bacterium]